MSWNQCPDPQSGDRTSCDSIQAVIVPRAVDLGEMTVRRALPSTQSQMVGPFIFFDQMGPAQFGPGEGIDVRPHPHVNLATLTYLLEGEIRHRDSLGTDILIRPGEVNWMRAGRGIVHSERTSDERRASGQRLSGLQMWVALPADQEESDPEFIHLGADELPIVNADGAQCRLVAGRALRAESPLNTASDTLFMDVDLSAEHTLSVDATYEEQAVYTVSGEIDISGDRFGAGQLLVLHPGASIPVSAKTDARFMVLGGAPMDGPRYIWWNFVSSRLERIEQAKKDWSDGNFDIVPGDDEEFIPLPEDRGTPRAISGVSGR